MQITTTYNFKVVANGREYAFNITATSQEEAKNILLTDLQDVAISINIHVPGQSGTAGHL